MRFREFVHQLDARGALQHVPEPINPRFDLAARLRRHDGQPMLFEHVRGSDLPVVGNVFGSLDLLAENLGFPKVEWISRLRAAIDHPARLVEQEATFDFRTPDLGVLPILTHYPKDQGPYITSGVVFAERNGARNVSFHRLSRIGPDRFVGRLVEKRDLHSMYLDARAHGEDLDVAVAIGSRAGVLVAAATSVERGFDELGIAAALEPDLAVTPARTNRTRYPVDSEVVLEGRILHDETTREGPFVDLTNSYDVVREQPVFVIDRIALRPGALYHALLPGGYEHRVLMGAPRTPTIHRALVAAGLEVTNVHLTEGGSGWLDAVVAIRKRSDDDPRRAIDAAVRGHPSLKRVTVVDPDVDVTDPREVDYAVTMYWEAGKEVVLRGVKGSSLDPMASADGIGSKLGLDATRPMVVPPEKELKMRRAEPPSTTVEEGR